MPDSLQPEVLIKVINLLPGGNLVLLPVRFYFISNIKGESLRIVLSGISTITSSIYK
jgi:hypothetical protein